MKRGYSVNRLGILFHSLRDADHLIINSRVQENQSLFDGATFSQ